MKISSHTKKCSNVYLRVWSVERAKNPCASSLNRKTNIYFNGVEFEVDGLMCRSLRTVHKMSNLLIYLTIYFIKEVFDWFCCLALKENCKNENVEVLFNCRQLYIDIENLSILNGIDSIVWWKAFGMKNVDNDDDAEICKQKEMYKLRVAKTYKLALLISG